MQLYPLYFDAQRSIRAGRRTPLQASTASPTLAQLVGAAKKLQLNFTVDEKKRHPRDPFSFGRITITAPAESKSKIIRDIGSLLPTINITPPEEAVSKSMPPQTAEDKPKGLVLTTRKKNKRKDK